MDYGSLHGAQSTISDENSKIEENLLKESEFLLNISKDLKCDLSLKEIIEKNTQLIVEDFNQINLLV